MCLRVDTKRCRGEERVVGVWRGVFLHLGESVGQLVGNPIRHLGEVTVLWG